MNSHYVSLPWKQSSSSEKPLHLLLLLAEPHRKRLSNIGARDKLEGLPRLLGAGMEAVPLTTPRPVPATGHPTACWLAHSSSLGVRSPQLKHTMLELA